MTERITHDKPYDLKGDVNARMILNIDEMLGQLYWTMAQLENKMSSGQGLLAGNNTSINQEIGGNVYGASSTATGSNFGSLTQWLSGPWTLDLPLGASVAAIRADPSAGTYNNYAPSGIDTAVLIELEPGGAVTLTGLKAPTNQQKRLAMLRNRDSSNNITLKHANSGSSTANQFSLPSSTDVVLGPGQSAWMYYDPARTAWTLAITGHVSGGIAIGNGITVATGTLTEAQLEGLNTTPVTLIAAQGANTTIVPVRASISVNVTTAYGTNPSWTIAYTASSSGNSIGTSFSPNTNSTGQRIGHLVPVDIDYTSQAAFDGTVNKGLDLESTADLAAGGVVTGAWAIAYYVMSSLP